MRLSQAKEQARARGEAVMRAVVNYRWQVGRGLKNRLEMRLLRGLRRTPRQDPRNQHEAQRTDPGCVSGVRHRSPRVDRARADDRRDAGGNQPGNTFLPVIFCQKRPVPHRTAVNDGRHACLDQFLPLSHERTEIRAPALVARRHQCGHAARECCVWHRSSAVLQLVDNKKAEFNLGATRLQVRPESLLPRFRPANLPRTRRAFPQA